MAAGRTIREVIRSAVGGLPAAFWAMWWGIVVNRLASFVIAFLPLFLVRVGGMGAAGAGRIVSLLGLGIALAGALGGALADRLGRRTTMVGGLLCGAATVAALAFARSIPALAALSLLAGATTELYRPAVAAAIADVVPSPDRPRAYALVHWAANLGLAGGLLLAGLAAERSFVALFLADAFTSLVFAAVVLRFVPESRPAGMVRERMAAGVRRVLADRPFLVFLALHLGMLVVFFQWQLGLQLDMAAHGLGPSAYAIVMSFNCAGVVVAQPILAPRLRRFDPAHLLAAMAVLFGLGYGVNALGGTLPVYLAGAVLWTLGEVVGLPTAATLVAELAPVEVRGRYQGAFSGINGLAFTLAPLLGGELFERLGGRALWLACLGIALLVASGHLAAGRARRRHLTNALTPPSTAT